ncbi:MAG TPA: glutamate--tRNA ligase family protein, partial [Candidatus Saccharimonadales bacterium]|nr:glutamate--tRNA ligase family protein [Candidatus Saccharimonadales bacterium]
AARRAAAGETSVVRMKVPLDGECVMHDLLRGNIRKEWESVDDQVLLKSDGLPTYHLANVVDDHLMGISHVIRGEEWISSLPKHVELYRQFGWTPPVFCHLPLLRNPDRSKLSKRKNPTSITYYRRAGILPEALRNYLGLMGWSMPGGEDKFTMEQMSANLKLEQISLGGPVFDVAKLQWLNGRYIREDYSDTALLEALEGWSLGRESLGRIVPLVHKRLEKLSDWGPLTAPFFCDEVRLDPADLPMKGKTPEETAEILQMVLWSLEAARAFDAAGLKDLFESFATKLEVKLRDLCIPFYVALSGSKTWTPLFESMEVLGADLVRIRVRRAIAALGGLSAKKLKALEERRAGLFGRSDG